MNKKNVFIIHGAYGNPDENWFPWLKNEIEKLGVEVFAPTFPTPEGQSLLSWNNVFENYKKYVTEKTIFIGHSLGPAYILNLLEKLESPIMAAYFVAPFIGLLNNPDFDLINYSITDRNFQWNLINNHCSEFYIYHSDNDPYVSQEKSAFVANQLNTKKYIIINGAGHFNESAGYIKFPSLLEDIKKQIGNEQ
jgi:predicted alpha/beta hydrolase family esterase